MGAPIPPSDSRRLAEELADPLRHPINQAIALAKASATQGSAIGNHLSDLLRRETERADRGRKSDVLRILELLCQIDAEQLVLPFRGLLIGSTDTEIRSKVVLMVGRTTKNLPWISRRLLDPNVRVQANAVEALWGIDAPEARELLMSSLVSPNGRVVANALVGLHKIGDVGSVARLFQMADHADEAFRLSARWAMAETGDPRFLGYLSKAYKTDSGKCQGMDLRSLTRLRRRIAELEQAGRLELKIWGARILAEGARRIGLSCWREAQEDPVTLKLLDISIIEAGIPIDQCALKAWPYPDALLVGCTRPRITSQADPYRLAIEAGLMDCVRVKRRRDLWVGDKFLVAGAEPLDPDALHVDTEDPLVENHLRSNRGFLRDAEIIAKVIPGAGARSRTSSTVAASMNKLMEVLGRVSGSRHLVVFLDPEKSLADDDLEGVLETAKESDVTIHGLAPDAPTSYAPFEALCEACGGTFQKLPMEVMATEILRTYEALLNRYELTYSGAEASGQRVPIEVKVYSTQGFGSTAAEL